MPNRRYIAARLYLPDLRSESLPSIVVVVDSSASTHTVLPAFKAELQSIVEECQPELTIVIMADAKVQRADEFQLGEAIEFNVEGFGGTDFRPAFGTCRSPTAKPCPVDLYHGRGRRLSGRAFYVSDTFGDYDTQPTGAVGGDRGHRCHGFISFIHASKGGHAPWGRLGSAMKILFRVSVDSSRSAQRGPLSCLMGITCSGF
jgi:hypothetical protein